MLGNPHYAAAMQYQAEHQHDPSKMTNIFDGEHYRSLLTKPVTVADETLPFCHFLDERDIALGLSTDGFCPFKRQRSQTAWPLVLFNYNLPPDERFRKRHLISVGIIPGPKKPTDLDSFLWPLVQELLQLAIGVTAFNACTKCMFLLHVYLIVVFGDIPAVAMVMRMKGQNGYSPCRMCGITGIRPPGASCTTHYVPLNRQKFPDATPAQFDPRDLPLRTHTQFLEQAKAVQYATTKTASEDLAKQYGIKGIPLLTCLSSLSFPASFPYDFMHLIWANLIRNLIRLWTAENKQLNHVDQDYVFAHKVWEKIGKESTDAKQHIPSAFGAKMPNIADEKSHMTCETYSM